MPAGAITSSIWSATGLPDGLTIDVNTGIISGTPTTPGTYMPNITVTTNWGADTKVVTINVEIPDGWKPIIDANQVINAIAGEAMTPYTVTGTNVRKTV